MSRMNIRPKTKLAETVQIVIFGAETEAETEIRSVSNAYAKIEYVSVCTYLSKNRIRV